MPLAVSALHASEPLAKRLLQYGLEQTPKALVASAQSTGLKSIGSMFRITDTFGGKNARDPMPTTKRFQMEAMNLGIIAGLTFVLNMLPVVKGGFAKMLSFGTAYTLSESVSRKLTRTKHPHTSLGTSAKSNPFAFAALNKKVSPVLNFNASSNPFASALPQAGQVSVPSSRSLINRTATNQFTPLKPIVPSMANNEWS